MKRMLPCLILCSLVWANGAWAQSNSAPMPGASNVVEAAPGPLLEQRQKLLTKINSAAQAGCGVAPYMSAFARIEGELKSGQNPESISREVESLTKNIDSQLARINILRTQRPSHVYRKPTVMTPDPADAQTPPADAAKAAAATDKTAAKTPAKTPATASGKAPDKSKLASLRQTMKEQYPDRYNDKMSDEELTRMIQDDPRLNYLLDQIPAGK